MQGAYRIGIPSQPLGPLSGSRGAFKAWAKKKDVKPSSPLPAQPVDSSRTGLLHRINFCNNPHELKLLGEQIPEATLWGFVERSKTDPSVSTASANALSALVRVGVPLSGRDIGGGKFPGADLTGAVMDQTRVEGTEDNPTDLTGARLSEAYLNKIDFRYVQMTGFDTGRLSAMSGHEGTVMAMTYCNELGVLVTAGQDKTIRIWDTTQQVLVGTISLEASKIWRSRSVNPTLRMSRDGYILVLGLGKYIRIWRRSDQSGNYHRIKTIRKNDYQTPFDEFEINSKFQDDKAPDRCLAVSPYGTRLAWTEGGGRKVVVYSITDKQHLKSREVAQAIYEMTFVDLDCLILGTAFNNLPGYKRESNVSQWEISRNIFVQELLVINRHRGSIRFLQAFEDGRIAVGCHTGQSADQGVINIFEYQSSESDAADEGWESGDSVPSDDDDQSSGSDSQDISWTEPWTIVRSMTCEDFERVVFTPDLSLAVVLESPTVLIRWDIPKNIQTTTTLPSGQSTDLIALTDNAGQVLIESGNDIVPVRLAEAKYQAPDTAYATDKIESVVFVPSVKRLVCLGPNGLCVRDLGGRFLYAIPDGRNIEDLNIIDDPVRPILVFTSGYGFLNIYDLDGNRLYSHFTNRQMIAASPINVTAQGTSILWGQQGGGVLRRVKISHQPFEIDVEGKIDIFNESLKFRTLHGRHFQGFHLSPGGAYLVVPQKKGIQIYTYPKMRRYSAIPYTKSGSRKFCVCFSPDDRFFIVARLPKVVVLDLSTRTKTNPPKGYQFQIGFEPTSVGSDGSLAAVGRKDGQILLWDVGQRTPICNFKGHDDVVNTIQFFRNGEALMMVTGSSDRSTRCWEIDRANSRALLQWTTNPRLVIQDCENL